VVNAFAFSYSGLVSPLGLGVFGVSPALVGLLASRAGEAPTTIRIGSTLFT